MSSMTASPGLLYDQPAGNVPGVPFSKPRIEEIFCRLSDCASHGKASATDTKSGQQRDIRRAPHVSNGISIGFPSKVEYTKPPFLISKLHFFEGPPARTKFPAAAPR